MYEGLPKVGDDIFRMVASRRWWEEYLEVPEKSRRRFVDGEMSELRNGNTSVARVLFATVQAPFEVMAERAEKEGSEEIARFWHKVRVFLYDGAVLGELEVAYAFDQVLRAKREEEEVDKLREEASECEEEPKRLVNVYESLPVVADDYIEVLALGKWWEDYLALPDEKKGDFVAEEWRKLQEGNEAIARLVSEVIRVPLEFAAELVKEEGSEKVAGFWRKASVFFQRSYTLGQLELLRALDQSLRADERIKGEIK